MRWFPAHTPQREVMRLQSPSNLEESIKPIGSDGSRVHVRLLVPECILVQLLPRPNIIGQALPFIFETWGW